MKGDTRVSLRSLRICHFEWKGSSNDHIICIHRTVYHLHVSPFDAWQLAVRTDRTIRSSACGDCMALIME